jgi:hypothetical protein
MSAFEKAFASARKGGKKEFSFGGKSYNTKLKSEAAKPKATPKNAPVPTAAPRAKAATGYTQTPSSKNSANLPMSKGVPEAKTTKKDGPRLPPASSSPLERMSGSVPNAKKSATLKSAYLGSKINEAAEAKKKLSARMSGSVDTKASADLKSKYIASKLKAK